MAMLSRRLEQPPNFIAPAFERENPQLAAIVKAHREFTRVATIHRDDAWGRRLEPNAKTVCYVVESIGSGAVPLVAEVIAFRAYVIIGR